MCVAWNKPFLSVRKKLKKLLCEITDNTRWIKNNPHNCSHELFEEKTCVRSNPHFSYIIAPSATTPFFESSCILSHYHKVQCIPEESTRGIFGDSLRSVAPKKLPVTRHNTLLILHFIFDPGRCDRDYFFVRTTHALPRRLLEKIYFPSLSRFLDGRPFASSLSFAAASPFSSSLYWEHRRNDRDKLDRGPEFSALDKAFPSCPWEK